MGDRYGGDLGAGVIVPDYPTDFSRVAKCIALQTTWQQFETKRGNFLLWELEDTRWNWLNVYRFEAGENPESYLGRVNI